MNTLNIIRKQIAKASAIHDAQILHTAYRGVAVAVHQSGSPVKGSFTYRGRSYTK